MTTFTIYPAIDLKDNLVVRLKQGRRKDMKTYDLSPQQAAESWIAQGANWLHVVNLNGAFGENSTPNLSALEKIIAVAKGKASIQFGGGIHSIDSIKNILSLGVTRVILSTAAVVRPSLMCEAIKIFGPERVVLGIDTQDGVVRIAGWEKVTTMTPVALAEYYVDYGLKTVIYTNIRHDGMESGVDISSTEKLKSETGLKVIASGGVGSLTDIQMVKTAGLSGVVVGKALYEKRFTLSEAIKC